MPYAVVNRIEPVLGKGQELIRKAEEATRQVNAAGARTSLTATAFGNDTAVYTTAVFDSLAAAEAFPTSAVGQAVQARLEELRPLVAARPQQQLYEILAMPQPGGPPSAFHQVFTLFPQGGKQNEFMQLLMQRMGVEQASGTRGAVAMPVTGNIGSVTVLVLFGSLAELEKDRSLRATDAAWQSFTTQIGAISAAPPQAEIRRVIVPLPPQ